VSRSQSSPPAGKLAPRRAADGAFLRDVLAGLTRTPRRLSSRWFYDAHGSRIFQWITQLPEYYPTRVEREILERHGAAIAAPLAGRPCTVVDLGAGDGHKTCVLLERLREQGAEPCYAPIDVSREALEEARARATERLSGLAVSPVCAEYAAGLRRLDALGTPGPRLVLFLGSSIGNLEHPEATRFLQGLRRLLRPGDHALVGFDLVKPLRVLRRAYDDPHGVTRAFNLNLLSRMNRELGADFDLSAFRHRATWDPDRPAMESWLESTRAQVVHLAGRALAFARGERIHTEIACKYTRERVAAFRRDARFAEVAAFEDARGWFTDVLWRVD
jgi:L-histidine N-alpha-methyltransferase